MGAARSGGDGRGVAGGGAQLLSFKLELALPEGEASKLRERPTNDAQGRVGWLLA